jgi:GH25 family lysozyme M1 (1,4-beta-N-acetylmuramidase)
MGQGTKATEKKKVNNSPITKRVTKCQQAKWQQNRKPNFSWLHKATTTKDQGLDKLVKKRHIQNAFTEILCDSYY